MRPWLGGPNPVTIENSVVLPAPFGPISAVMRPACAVNEARSTASKPPNRFDTCATRSRGSAMAAFQRCGRNAAGRPQATIEVGKDAGDPARRERDDQNENAAVDDEIEAGRVAGHKLGELSERLDHQCAEERTENGADAADDGGEQRLDRNPRPVGDAGVDE